MACPEPELSVGFPTKAHPGLTVDGLGSKSSPLPRCFSCGILGKSTGLAQVWSPHLRQGTGHDFNCFTCLGSR